MTAINTRRSPGRHSSQRLSRSERGFSILEALFGLVLTMIGFSALFSLQGAQMEASLSARDLSAASNLSERAIAQLTRESYQWTGLMLPQPILSNADGSWRALTEAPVDQNLQPHISRDQEKGSTLRHQRFCIHYWLNPLQGAYEGLMNGRVRIIWSRDPADTTSISQLCGEGNADQFNPADHEWLSVTTPFVLRRHP